MNREDIKTLGVPKVFVCPNCGKKYNRTNRERQNLAECMINNCVGLWCLEHCGSCGWVNQTYPTRVNGESVSKEVCEKL